MPDQPESVSQWADNMDSAATHHGNVLHSTTSTPVEVAGAPGAYLKEAGAVPHHAFKLERDPDQPVLDRMADTRIALVSQIGVEAAGFAMRTAGHVVGGFGEAAGHLHEAGRLLHNDADFHDVIPEVAAAARNIQEIEFDKVDAAETAAHVLADIATQGGEEAADAWHALTAEDKHLFGLQFKYHLEEFQRSAEHGQHTEHPPAGAHSPVASPEHGQHREQPVHLGPPAPAGWHADQSSVTPDHLGADHSPSAPVSGNLDHHDGVEPGQDRVLSPGVVHGPPAPADWHAHHNSVAPPSTDHGVVAAPSGWNAHSTTVTPADDQQVDVHAADMANDFGDGTQ